MTRSLSNLIKYYNFNVTQDEKKLIDFDSKVDNFIPGILSHGEVEVRNLEREEFDAEFPEELFSENEDEKNMDFSEEAISELLVDAHKQAENILKKARAQAEELVEQAKISAEIEKNKLLEESRKMGYQEGLIQANDEVAAEREELEGYRVQLENDYQQLVETLEPNFIQLVIDLIKKITGVLVEDKKDIIIYLIEKSLNNIGKTKELQLRVSSEDIDMVTNAEEKIKNIVGEECEVYVIQDASLKQNQCIIEADNHIVDCSLNVQMNGLLEDLKMMM